MPEPVVRNWFIRRDGNITGPLTESELKSRLPMLTQSGIEIRQGDSQWYPPSVVIQKFEQLADQGVYVRRSGQVEGPYTALRAVEVLQEYPSAEAKEGKKGVWVAGPTYLAQLKNRASDGQKVRAQCPHCEKKLVMLASLTGKAANCPNCSRSFRVPQDAVVVDPENLSTPKSVARNVPARLGKEPIAKGTIVVPSANVKVISTQPTQPSVAKVVQPASPKGPIVVQVSNRPTGAWNTSGVPVKAVPVTTAVPMATAVMAGPSAFELDDFSPPPVSLHPGAGIASSVTRQPSDRSVHYTVPGVFILIWGILVVLFILAGIALLGFRVWFLINLTSAVSPGQVFTDGVRVMSLSEVRTQGFIKIGLQALSLLFTSILAYIFINGGIAMFRRDRRSLSMARTAAVFAAIPCFGCFICPFGIWGCIGLFSEHAKRDFR